MMKLLVRFLLALILLLPGGYALTSQESNHGFPAHFQKLSKQDGTRLLREQAAVSQGPLSGARRKNDESPEKKTEDEEDDESDDDDDEETKSSKKHTTGNNQHNTTSYRSLAVNERFQLHQLPSCEHLSYFSSFKVIMNGAIRI